MDQTWCKLKGDARGEVLNTTLAAAIATLVQPGRIAIRTERAVEVRSSEERLSLLIAEHCVVRGEVFSSRSVMDAFLAGDLDRQDPGHPFLDCMAGLHNAHAILDWQKRGEAQRLVANKDRTRTWYKPGPYALAGNVETIGTKRLAVAAALGRLGMPLYNITGEGKSHEYIVHRFSQDMMQDRGEETFEPVHYDAKDLITQLNEDRLPADHPFALAYCARKNRDNLVAHIDREVPLLILTPDALKKSGRYDPFGLHSYIHPNAKGDIWDGVKKHFFG
jgi:hypothetical protein